MKVSINKWLKSAATLGVAAGFLASCNKDLPYAEPNVVPPTAGNTSITELLNDADFSLLKAAVARAVPATTSNFTPLSTLFSDRTAEFTFFAPNNAAFTASGISSAVISGMRPGQLDTILRYHIVGGYKLLYTSTSTPTTFPNIQLPSQLVLSPASATLPPGLRMPIFPAKRNGSWVNNIPVTTPDIVAANGVVHKTAAVVLPPSQYLWNRIDTATDLTYLRAAIKRADEGVAAGSRLEDALNNPAANLTVFAPVDAAFRGLLTAQITAALMAQGLDQATATTQATALASSPTVFTNPALATVLSPTNVKGIVVYHLLGVRAFTNNFPTTATSYPTLLNTAIATHPGVSLTVTLGATGVTAASVKGVANPSASNVIVNNRSTSDQHYINGVLHKIDQVLRPQ